MGLCGGLNEKIKFKKTILIWWVGLTDGYSVLMPRISELSTYYLELFLDR
jgi:hypothetical protein